VHAFQVKVGLEFEVEELLTGEAKLNSAGFVLSIFIVKILSDKDPLYVKLTSPDESD